MTPDEMGNAPIRVDGTTYWLSHHAADRCLDMGVPIHLLEHIIRGGQWRHPSLERSKYLDTLSVSMGKVALMISYREPEPIIVTTQWSTTEHWRAAEHANGREYRGDQWTDHAINSWTCI